MGLFFFGYFGDFIISGTFSPYFSVRYTLRYFRKCFKAVFFIFRGWRLLEQSTSFHAVLWLAIHLYP